MYKKIKIFFFKKLNDVKIRELSDLNINLGPQSRLFTIAAWPYFSYGFLQAVVELAFQGRIVRWPLSTSPDDSLFSPHLLSNCL